MNILQIMNERKVDELEVTGEQLKEYLDSGEHTHTQCSIEFPIRGNYGHVLVDNIEIAKMLDRVNENGGDLQKFKVAIERTGSDWFFLFIY